MKTRKIISGILLILSFLTVFPAYQAKASNIKIDKEASITGINTGDKTAYITFDLSWENSWRSSTGAANWDGAWIFAKYKEKDGTEWKHVLISTIATDHSVTSNNGVSAAFSTGVTDNKGLGVFAYRQKDGSGNINWDGVKLKWNYENNGVKNINNVEVKIYAIEMVYVNKGAFKVGSGSKDENSAFYAYPDSTLPYAITSENAITSGQQNGSLYYKKHFYAAPYYGVIPAEFPKGFNPFWCMKFEITQGQYVDFLNSLDRKQQIDRVNADVSLATVKNTYVMSNTATLLNRCGVRCNATVSATDPIVFYCDLNGNGIPNEKNDGQNISLNFICWADGAAFSDWAGLRPMTEFEYEKACRGTLSPVVNEFAWGSTNITNTRQLLDTGMVSEAPSNTDANAIYDNPASIPGPVRAGFFIKTKGTREQNGVSFYGISDLSGNLFERCVSVSNSTGVTYKGTNGDGELNEWGNATNTDWPGLNAIGSGFRGGSYFYGSVFARVSDRQYAGLGDWQRYNHYGFRAVRSAE